MDEALIRLVKLFENNFTLLYFTANFWIILIFIVLLAGIGSYFKKMEK